jgi:hypothetical protein
MKVNDSVPGPVFSDMALFTVSETECQACRFAPTVCHYTALHITWQVTLDVQWQRTVMLSEPINISH